jgi:2-hydroxychromene-2-carboxylate isomerase
MTTAIDMFWSFRSPYSYLASKGALDLLEKYDVEICLRPILPLALRKPEVLFTPENLGKAKYLLMDWDRRAEMLGMPHAWPSPDPIVQNMEDFTIAERQPYIYRLTYLGVEAQRQGRGLQFAAEVSALTFGGVKDWHLGDHLEKAAVRAGLSLAEMDQTIADTQFYQAIVNENQTALEQAGHWGVPTFVVNNEPFFGQDRVDTLCWRLDQLGLQV